MSKILTIGIPTYKRPASCAKLLVQITDIPFLNKNVSVIVVNDSGSDVFDNEYLGAIHSAQGGRSRGKL